MNICIYGAGAVGGNFAARLARAGRDITVIARGPHGEAINKKGLKLLVRDETFHADLKVTDDPRSVGPQDLVIVTLKGPSLSGIVDPIKSLLKKETPIIFAMNGIPWWYFYGFDEIGKERRIDMLDPGNRWWDEIGPQRALGGVIYSANIIVEPGVIRNNSPGRNLLIVGEPGGAISKRCEHIKAVLECDGLAINLEKHIRSKIWDKLLGNLSVAPICTITSSPTNEVLSNQELKELASNIMMEAITVAGAMDIELDIDIDARIKTVMKLKHKPSMLQDFEQGRPLEFSSILLTPQRLGKMAGVSTPYLDTVISLLKQKSLSAGLPIL